MWKAKTLTQLYLHAIWSVALLERTELCLVERPFILAWHQ